MSATSCAMRAPFGVQSIEANTNSSQRPSRCSRSETCSRSFLEQIVLTIPRRFRARTMPALRSPSCTSSSLSVPVHRVSSRSQMTALTGSASAGIDESRSSGVPLASLAPSPTFDATRQGYTRNSGVLRAFRRPRDAQTGSPIEAAAALPRVESGRLCGAALVQQLAHVALMQPADRRLFGVKADRVPELARRRRPGDDQIGAQYDRDYPEPPRTGQ